MIMLILTIILMTITFILVSAFNARYSFGFLARRFYTTDKLSDKFSEQFASQLAKCSLPCKRLVESKVMQMWEGPDTRPIIYAAGEIYINENICKHFSDEVFSAGLAYEKAHHDSAFYIYSVLIMFIIFISCMPLIYILNNIFQSIAVNNPSSIISLFTYIVNLLQSWPLLQFLLIFMGIALLEFAMGKAVVNFYAYQGSDLNNLLQYLQYVEKHVTLGVNQTFNISSNRKYCKKLLQKNRS